MELEEIKDAIIARKRRLVRLNQRVAIKGKEIQALRKNINRIEDEIHTLSELPRKQHEAKENV